MNDFSLTDDYSYEFEFAIENSSMPGDDDLVCACRDIALAKALVNLLNERAKEFKTLYEKEMATIAEEEERAEIARLDAAEKARWDRPTMIIGAHQKVIGEDGVFTCFYCRQQWRGMEGETNGPPKSCAQAKEQSHY